MRILARLSRADKNRRKGCRSTPSAYSAVRRLVSGSQAGPCMWPRGSRPMQWCPCLGGTSSALRARWYSTLGSLERSLKNPWALSFSPTLKVGFLIIYALIYLSIYIYIINKMHRYMFDQSQSQSQSESDNHLSVIMLSPYLVIRIILLSLATIFANCEN